MTMFVRGIGAWMEGKSDVAAVLRGEVDPRVTRPACVGLPTRLLRGTSVLTRMSVDVAAQALHGSGMNPDEVVTIFASAWGEMTIAIEQMEMMVSGDGEVSPMRFKNSVHNTAAGVFSIAHGNHRSSLSLAAGPLTVAYALLEAELAIGEGEPEVVVVVADEALPTPLTAFGRAPAFAAGFALAAHPGRTALAELGSVRREPAQASASAADELGDNPCRCALDLLRAIADFAGHPGAKGDVALGDVWSISVRRLVGDRP